MVAGVVVLIAGLIVMAVALIGRAGQLPRNHWVGIRMPSTLRSDAAWHSAHRASWAFTFLAGAVFVVDGVLILFQEETSAHTTFLLLGLVPLLAGAWKARQVAREIQPDDLPDMHKDRR